MKIESYLMNVPGTYVTSRTQYSLRLLTTVSLCLQCLSSRQLQSIKIQRQIQLTVNSFLVGLKRNKVLTKPTNQFKSNKNGHRQYVGDNEVFLYPQL